MDGQSERTNQSLEQYLRIVCGQDQHAWAEWLPLAQYTRNLWPSSMTKKTPYELILGYTPNVHQPNRATLVPGITERLEQIKEHQIASQLKLPDTWKIHNVFHVSLLMPYKEMDKHGPNFLEPPSDLIDGEEEWEIVKILRHRTYRKKKQYLIQWKGYALAYDSWVDESGLHAPKLLAGYKKQLV